MMALLFAATIGPSDYQVFIRGWQPETKPFCARIESTAQWQRILRPAAVGFGNKPFAPPAAWWNTHAVLLIARSAYAWSDTVLRFRSFERAKHGLTVDYTFSAPPPASSTMRTWMGVVVSKPVLLPVTFVENGKPACVLGPGEKGLSAPH